MTLPIPATIIEKIGHITTMAVEITSAGKYHVFASWSGHVNGVSVYAHRSDADYSGLVKRETVFSAHIGLDRDGAEQQLDDTIKNMECLR